ncbi:formate dehydrogenase (quinone-dependent) catalytic subunit [Enhydrobacter aerosaccus]|uniref:Formate dehydrogenase (Quinone-dependent) catalytic subunit n=3 Tax=Enhydrobacter aerosaccus TaxID=225324 RepID=A0A1T4PN71_9HYPH|nr:formate dehydrogenase (quinone-dependent) catalytic subunit [Enhydrobacter aerosaccus]
MTNSWNDIKNADVILIMGGNAAEAHPCGFKWVVEAKAHNGAKLVVVDPRFTRSAAVADFYAPIRPGTDIAFLSGVMRYLLGAGKIQQEYVKAFTNAGYIVKEGFKFEDGLFAGYDEAKKNYVDRSTWDYEFDEQGMAKVDDTLQHPRCVINLLKTHVDRYTPEMVERICGTPKDKFLKVCELIASTSTGDRSMTSMYALGWTQHTTGAQNIRSMAMIQLLLGNIGIPGGGVNALRGHSNVQGITDLALLSTSTPGYLVLPTDREATYADYMKSRRFKPQRPGQTSFWQNYEKFFVSQQKSFFGAAATKDNDWAYDYLPKFDVPYDALKIIDVMAAGQMNGLFCQGMNIMMAGPNKTKIRNGLSKLKWLVSIDPLETETARFWENHGEFNDVDPKSIQTEVFQLPATAFAEEEGSATNSSRLIQWHWKAAEGPGESRGDIQIISDLRARLRALYAKEGGAFPDPILNLAWNYSDPGNPDPAEVLKDINGYALEDVPDPADPAKLLLRAGQLLPTFGVMRDDGKTSGGCWIYTGVYTEAGNMAQRRNASDPTGKGVYPNWGFSWPANRRILYNRASADAAGKPWSERKKYMWWNGSKWTGPDVPDYAPTVPPDKAVGPFIMNQEGTARLFARTGMPDGPFPEHYEAMDAFIANPLHPKVSRNPVVRVFAADAKSFGTPDKFPIVATTYRLTEHFHYWTKNAHANAVLQPELFVEMGERLAKAKGIQSGDWVEVTSQRGSIKAKAAVTKRIRPIMVDGKPCDIVGVPIHYGFIGLTRKAHPVNTLTPPVGDVSAQTPEFKAFLVDVKKTTPPAQAAATA